MVSRMCKNVAYMSNLNIPEIAYLAMVKAPEMACVLTVILDGYTEPKCSVYVSARSPSMSSSSSAHERAVVPAKVCRG